MTVNMLEARNKAKTQEFARCVRFLCRVPRMKVFPVCVSKDYEGRDLVIRRDTAIGLPDKASHNGRS
jgi:hypothetical protein